MSRKKALVLHGGWKWHYPNELAELTANRLLEGYEVECTDDVSILESNRLHEFDVMIPIWTADRISIMQEQSIVKAVERGVGLVGWHALAAAFDSEHPHKFFKMVLGGHVLGHPGDFIEYEVNFPKEDPLTEGLSSFKISSEQYYMHTDPGNDVIATTKMDGAEFTWLKGNPMPVAWKRQWGKGRVFYHTLGHSPKDFEIHEVMELTIRGIRWATR
ncbi:ThuA domain-containing protein [Neobacillus sp. NPDC097160]|uniref:ThuA domain-containing protein n=1 Tax=Neobacillus sp. NPDC097160 TaxID=3364298 RepID=UPI0038040A70